MSEERDTSVMVRKSGVKAATHMFLLLCVLSCAAFLAWAWFGKLDIVSMADGKVAPSTKVKRVEHLEGGIVQEILIKEGSIVKLGEKLIVLEKTIQGSDVKEMQVRINALIADVARLKAEMEGAGAVQFPEGFAAANPSLAEQAQNLFLVRKERLRSQTAEQRQAVNQAQEEIQRITVRLKNSRKTMDLALQELAISEDLLQEQLTTELKHLQLKREVSAITSRIEEDEAALRKARATLAEARERLNSIQSSFSEESAENYRKAKRELDEFVQRNSKFSDTLQRTVIRSPVDGVVKSLNVVNEGEVVKPGETIMLIVPSDDKLIVEAHLPIGDIGYVEKGQNAVVKLATRDAGLFGSLEGTVMHVSPDAFVTEEGRTYYSVRIETNTDSFEKDGAQYKLYPGMQVITYIHTGQRTIMEYLLTPFMDSLTVALRER